LDEREAVFHLFFRKNPFQSGFSIACGLAGIIEYIETFQLEEELTYLATLKGGTSLQEQRPTARDGRASCAAGFSDDQYGAGGGKIVRIKKFYSFSKKRGYALDIVFEVHYVAFNENTPMAHSYEYPRAALTVDCVVFGFDEGDLKLLLIQRGIEPFAGKWALPGGFVRVEENLDEAALRELQEEAGVGKVYLEQLYTFGEPKRDPRERVVTVAYYALVKLGDHRIKGATDAHSAAWFAVSDLPRVAFDHHEIIDVALERLKSKVRYEPIGFELLAPKFTLTQLQHLYETILETTLDKRNFRKKILGMDLLTETDEIEQDVAHRAARLYRFDEAKCRHLKKKGFNFEL
jgi:8-oxo-dGTP diphosphatase